MNKVFLCLAFSCAMVSAQQSIHLNQVGYYPESKKVAVVLDTNATIFSILKSSTGEKVYNGQLSQTFYYPASQEKTRLADFSAFKLSGTYLLASGHDTSYVFSIDSQCNRAALNASLRSFYYQRCTYDLLPQFADMWNRYAGHPDLGIPVFESLESKSYDVHGGWYDAGDYGKYVVNAGITCGSILGFYELCPNMIGDNLNIPESGNNKSDLLDEVKYELDWLMRMQDVDGGVFFKVGPLLWSDDVMPEDDLRDRYIIGKSTTSTLDFAAVMAMAGRIYKQYDAGFAGKCSDAAEKAWSWACVNRSIAFPSERHGTGPYEDGTDLTYKDEFFWAAAELYISTDKQAYKDSVISMLATRKITGAAWWQDVNNLGFYSLAFHKKDLGETLNNFVKKEIINYADTLVNRIKNCGYKISMEINDYLWGSTGTIGNHGVALVYAHALSGKQEYLDAMILTTDYLFGKNPVGYSYITGFGSMSPLTPHSRVMRSDWIDEPIPGFVVGGANHGDNGGDAPLTEVVESGAAPAKCYIDNVSSWASNEVAINQNAPWVVVLGYLEKYKGGDAVNTKRPDKKIKKHCSFLHVKRTAQWLEINSWIPTGSHNARISIHDLEGREIRGFSMHPSDRNGELNLRIKNISGVLIIRLVIDGKVVSRTVMGIK